jgi:PAS domain S-box-containing protein
MTPTPIRLLLLDKNAAESQLVLDALTEQAPGEFAVTKVERLAEALAQVQAGRFDAVLCDLDLPDSTGLDSAQAIIAVAPEVAVVVLTPARDAHLGHKAIELGAQDYLHKGDLVPPLILRTLRYAVERNRLVADLREANRALESGVAERTADLEKATRSLRASEARFRNVFADSGLVTLLIDAADGRIVEANRAAGAYYGWDPARLKSMNICDINVLSANEVKAHIEEAHTRRRMQFDFRHRLASGEVRDVEVYSTPVTAAGEGGHQLLHSVVIDVTERKQAEAARLQQADSMVRQYDELERFNRLSVGRELDMIELKRQVNALSLELGRAAPFNLAFAEETQTPGDEAKDSGPAAAGARR